MYEGVQGQVLASRHWNGMLRETEELEDMKELWEGSVYNVLTKCRTSKYTSQDTLETTLLQRYRPRRPPKSHK